MKDFSKFTDEELNRMFHATVTIKDTMQKYEEWKTLVDESDIYRECLNLQIGIMNEEKKRLLEHEFNSEENEIGRHTSELQSR